MARFFCVACAASNLRAAPPRLTRQQRRCTRSGPWRAVVTSAHGHSPPACSSKCRPWRSLARTCGRQASPSAAGRARTAAPRAAAGPPPRAPAPPPPALRRAVSARVGHATSHAEQHAAWPYCPTLLGCTRHHSSPYSLQASISARPSSAALLRRLLRGSQLLARVGQLLAALLGRLLRGGQRLAAVLGRPKRQLAAGAGAGPGAPRALRRFSTRMRSSSSCLRRRSACSWRLRSSSAAFSASSCRVTCVLAPRAGSARGAARTGRSAPKVHLLPRASRFAFDRAPHPCTLAHPKLPHHMHTTYRPCGT